MKGSDFVIIFLIQNLVKDSLPTEVTIVLTMHDLFVCKLSRAAVLASHNSVKFYTNAILRSKIQTWP